MAIASTDRVLAEQGHEVRARYFGYSIAVERLSYPRYGAAIGAVEINLTKNPPKLRLGASLDHHVHIGESDESARTDRVRPLCDRIDSISHSKQTNRCI